MPRRPRSHELKALSLNRLYAAFTNEGWTIEDLRHDYGEDLLISIFENDVATSFSFFIQAKATDNINKYKHHGGKSIRFPIDTDHISYWNKFWEPVILTLWDAKSDITYWESIQKFIDEHAGINFNKGRVYIDVPIDNILNEEGIRRILVRTKSRFARFEREREGAQVLIDLIEDELKVNIEYEPRYGILIIKNPEGGAHIRAFGRFAEELSLRATELGIAEQEALEHSLKVGLWFSENVPKMPALLSTMLKEILSIRMSHLRIWFVLWRDKQN